MQKTFILIGIIGLNFCVAALGATAVMGVQDVFGQTCCDPTSSVSSSGIENSFLPDSSDVTDSGSQNVRRYKRVCIDADLITSKKCDAIESSSTLSVFNIHSAAEHSGGLGEGCDSVRASERADETLIPNISVAEDAMNQPMDLKQYSVGIPYLRSNHNLLQYEDRIFAENEYMGFLKNPKAECYDILRQANFFRTQEKYVSAIQGYVAVLNHPDATTMHLMIAINCIAQCANVNDVKRLYYNLLNKGGICAEIEIAIADGLVRCGEINTAVCMYSGIAFNPESEVSSLLAVANRLIKCDQLALAIRTCNRVINHKASELHHILDVADALKKCRKYDLAINTYHYAIHNFTNIPLDIMLTIAESFQECGDNNVAIQIYQSIVDIQNVSVQYVMRAADGLKKCEAFDSAKYAYHVMSNYPLAFDMVLTIAEGFEGCGDKKRAVEIYQQVVKTEGIPVKYKVSAANGLKKLGEKWSAILAYRSVAQHNASSHKVIFNAGKSLEKLGDILHAKTIYEFIRDDLNTDVQLVLEAVKCLRDLQA